MAQDSPANEILARFLWRATGKWRRTKGHNQCLPSECIDGCWICSGGLMIKWRFPGPEPLWFSARGKLQLIPEHISRDLAAVRWAKWPANREAGFTQCLPNSTPFIIQPRALSRKQALEGAGAPALCRATRLYRAAMKKASAGPAAGGGAADALIISGYLEQMAGNAGHLTVCQLSAGGASNQKVAPSPSFESTPKSKFIARKTAFTMDRPRPVPLLPASARLR